MLTMVSRMNRALESLYPLYILSAFSILIGFVNFPPGFLTGSKKNPSGWQERFLHFIEPAGSSYFPAVGHATPSWSLAIVASLVAVVGARVRVLLLLRSTRPTFQATWRVAGRHAPTG